MDYETLHATLVARLSAFDSLINDLSQFQTESVSGAGSLQQALVRLIEAKFWLQHAIAVLELAQPVEPEVSEVGLPTPTTEPKGEEINDTPVSSVPDQANNQA